jgi:OFA family oxalate/formate antiporter-like MFS transporter
MKYIILLASVVIQICLGGIYAWSAFVETLKTTADLSTAQTQIIFGCLFGVFTVSMVVAGKLLPRFGPRPIALVGGLLFGGGYLVASFSGGSFAIMLLGISLLAGVGTGAGYVCPLTTCMKWFPNRRGLVTGISMAGFGGGAVLLSSLAKHLLSGGMDVLTVFRWIALGYGVALLAAAAVMQFPAHESTVQVRPAPKTRFLARDPFFLALVLGMFCGTFAGMLVIGNLEPIAKAAGLGAVQATAAISVLAMGNAAGRITWGWISDRTDERMIPLKLTLLGIPLAMLAWVSSSPLFLAVSFAVGFGFGACFVVYAARVASRYGQARVGGVYPVVFLAYGVAGIIGPPLGGWLYDRTASYTPAIALSCGVVAVGLAGSILLLQKSRLSRVEPLFARPCETAGR